MTPIKKGFVRKGFIQKVNDKYAVTYVYRKSASSHLTFVKTCEITEEQQQKAANFDKTEVEFTIQKHKAILNI